jgi:hypothetical protein
MNVPKGTGVLADQFLEAEAVAPKPRAVLLLFPPRSFVFMPEDGAISPNIHAPNPSRFSRERQLKWTSSIIVIAAAALIAIVWRGLLINPPR